MSNKLLCWLLAGAFLAAAIGTRAAQDPADVALQAAIRKEVVDGDLQAAIEQYGAIAKGTNHAAAAQALLRMGRCYERLGNAKASETYERVLKQFADQKEAAQEARDRLAVLVSVHEKPRQAVGWYNGDWQSGVPGLANWYLSKRHFSRVYDDFVVPEGGWTVVGVFSNSRMDPCNITSASWEIRSDMSKGHGGKLLASGLSPATQTEIEGNGPFRADPMVGYRIEVDNLQVSLSPGRYWVSVAPFINGESYLSATLGKNAIGEPRGNNGLAFFDSTELRSSFRDAGTMGQGGQLGIGRDFSQGVVILVTNKQ